MQKLLDEPFIPLVHIKPVVLGDIINPEDNLATKLYLRLSDDLMGLWKWTVDKMTSESSAELRKIMYQFCEGKLATSFNDAFVKESICPNCKENVLKPWKLPEHMALDCETLTLT